MSRSFKIRTLPCGIYSQPLIVFCVLRVGAARPGADSALAKQRAIMGCRGQPGGLGLGRWAARRQQGALQNLCPHPGEPLPRLSRSAPPATIRPQVLYLVLSVLPKKDSKPCGTPSVRDRKNTEHLTL